MPSPAAPAAAPGGVAIAIAMAAVYLIWGSTYLAIRFALEGGLPPLLMAGVRFVIAGGLMYAALRLRGVPAPTRAQWRNLAVMALLLLGLGNGMVCIAEQTVSSGMAAVAVASSPLWMAVFAAIRGDRPTRVEWVGLAIGFAGVVWLNAGSSLAASTTGLVALVVATIAWAYGSIWSRDRDLPSPFMGAAGQMLLGGVMLLAAGAAIGERVHAWPTPKGMLSVAYLAGFGSIVAFSAYIWLLHHVRPVLAGSYAYVNPAIAVALGAWLAHERFSAAELVAMGVILLGVVAITLAKAMPAKTRAPGARVSR
ncbi:drug/metabolite exporter YedA [Cognatiluteimonas weifangensis]|uniref:Drug/metabolite exporter YedA n=1 Tax=Cognatiluteimonas weifangensis TaxID=2303539 RepID=A0A372DHY4_9GAMM|nr:drug/metabolite exporter YedA [Luteimonas weifangensis]RFP59175.1 drug/metabolite exporter YedA [Luteimonas weifangensis]